jgi:uncharacterized protein YkvS
MERKSGMNVKYTVNENFKSAEKDRKTSFLNKLFKIIHATSKIPSDKDERWKQT